MGKRIRRLTIMVHENTNWCHSVAGVCIRDGKVLLARHTYGAGRSKLIIPGGYLESGEMPQDAVKREFLEEVNILIEPKEIIGIRFNTHDWYVVFQVEYLSGEAKSDDDENDEVVWLDIEKALQQDDVPDLTKTTIRQALKENHFVPIPYQGKNSPYALYGIK